MDYSTMTDEELDAALANTTPDAKAVPVSPQLSAAIDYSKMSDAELDAELAKPAPAAPVAVVDYSKMSDAELDTELAKPVAPAADPVPEISKQKLPDVGIPEPEASANIVTRLARDIPVWAAKGAVAGGEMIMGGANLMTLGRAGKGFEMMGYNPALTKEFLNKFHSKETLDAQQRVQEAGGFKDTLVESLKNPSTIAGAAIESIPAMLAGGSVARGVMKRIPGMSAIVAGAIGEGAVTAASQAEQMRKANPDRVLNLKQEALAIGSGTITGGIGVFGGKWLNKLGVVDVNTFIAGGGLTKPGMIQSRIGQVLAGMASEGLFQELPQSMQEQIAVNLAADKPWNEGVAEAGVQGGLVGGVMGAGGAALGSHKANAATDVTQAGTKPAPPAMPVTEEIKAWLDTQAKPGENLKPETGNLNGEVRPTSAPTGEAARGPDGILRNPDGSIVQDQGGGNAILTPENTKSPLSTTQPAVSFPAEQPGAQAASPATGEPALAPVAPIASPDNIYMRMPIERVQEDAKLGNKNAIEALAVRQAEGIKDNGPAEILDQRGASPKGSVPDETVRTASGMPEGATPRVEGNATPVPLPVKRTFEEMQSTAAQVIPSIGRTVLMTHQKNGKAYTKPQKVDIVSVIDPGGMDKSGKKTEPIVRIRRTPPGNSQAIIEEVPLSRLSEPPNVVGLRMRGEYLSGLDKETSRKVASDARDFNKELYNSPLFTGQDDISAIEFSGKEKQRKMAEHRHLRIQAQKAAELLGEPNADMLDPKEKARLLPKLRELIAKNDVEAVQYQDSRVVKDLKRKKPEEYPAEDLPHEALAWKDGEWHFVSRTDGTVTRLSDGTIEQYDRFDPVSVAGVVEKDAPGYEQAMREFREQRADEIKAVDEHLDAKEIADAERTPEPAIKAVNPRTGQTELIGQEEGGFRLIGDMVSGQPAEITGQESGMFGGAESRGRGLDDLDAKGTADLKKVALREGVDLMRGSVDLSVMGAARVREAIREARRSAQPRNSVAQEIQDGTDETFGLDAGKFRTEETAPPAFSEFTEQKKQEAVKLLKTLLGDQVQVKTIAENIMTPDGQAALGKYQAGWIELVDGRADVKDTAAHEAVHAAIDLFLSPAERARLLDAVGGNEELLAENFVQYAKDRSGALGKVRIVADKLLRFLRTLFVQTSEGSVRADRITKFYEDLMLGKAAKQAGQSGGSAASFRVDPSEEAYQKIQKLYEAAQGETDPVKLEAIRTEFRQIKALAEQVNGQTAPADSLNTPEKRKELAAMSREELQSEAKARGLSPAGTVDVIRQRIQNAQDGERVRARSFLQTVQNETGLPKELIERLSAVDPQTYQQARTTDIFREFRMWLDGGAARVTQADAYVRSKDAPSAAKGAMFAALLDKYQSEDNFTAEQELVESFDEQLRESGRFIQASSLFASMSGKGFMKSVDKFLAKYKVSVPDDILESIRQDYITATRINDEAARMEAVAAVIERIASLAPTKWNDWISAYRYTNMLSNPRSHERNIWGNFFQTFVARPLALAGQGKVVGAAQYNTAAFKALPNAIQAFKDSWNSGSTGNRWFETMNSNMSKFESERMRQGAQAVPARKLLLVVGRLLEAQDKFFAAMIAHGETYRLVQKGVSPEVAVSAGNQLADDLLYREKLGNDMGDKTKAFGVRALDGFGYAMEQLRKTPLVGGPVGWFLPFLRTPVNVGKRMIEFSPLGFVRAPGAGKMTSEQFGRAAAGTAVALAGAMLALAGQTTGAPPKDKDERRLWYASGRRPWSVLIGDKWIPMWYFGSFAGALAIPAAIRDSWVDDPTTSNAAVHRKLMAISGGIASFYGSQTPFDGVGKFLDLAMGRSDYTTATSLAFNAGQFVPASGFLRWANQLMLDPVYRRGGSFEEGFKKDYPFFSQQTRPLMGPEVKNQFGRVLQAAEPVTRKTGSTLLPYDVDAVNPEWDARRVERNTEMKNRSKLNELVGADIRAAIKGAATPKQVMDSIGRMSGATKALREERSRLQQRAKAKFKDAGLTY